MDSVRSSDAHGYLAHPFPCHSWNANFSLLKYGKMKNIRQEKDIVPSVCITSLSRSLAVKENETYVSFGKLVKRFNGSAEGTNI